VAEQMALQGRRVGFVGAGMMASAMIDGLIRSGAVDGPGAVTAADMSAQQLEKLPEGVIRTSDNLEVARTCDIVVIAVKPHIVPKALSAIVSGVDGTKLVVSIAAGVTLETLESLVPGARVVRAMPNTPCLIGEAAVGFALGSQATEEDAQAVEALFQGVVLRVGEKDLAAVTAVSGSGPAYVFLFIEALADAGVRAGLSRPVALQLAAQTVKGSASMQLQTGQHPGVLKDQVCSPGGTTIAAVEALEQNGFRFAAMSAVAAANKRCQELASATGAK